MGAVCSEWFEALIADPGWTCEAKIDGQRAVWCDGSLWTRIGRRLRSEGVDDLALALSGAPSIDGEWAGGIYWAFDLPDCPGPHEVRASELRGVVARIDSPRVRLIPTCTEWEQVARKGWEGAVLKRRMSGYPRAYVRHATTPDWMKFRAATN
jgi:ATP-dependent DNA ligase